MRYGIAMQDVAQPDATTQDYDGTIRIYLMLRHGKGAWSIGVVPTLADLANALGEHEQIWESGKGERPTALVHIGYEAPIAEDYETLAEIEQRPVLMTAAALFAVPEDFLTGFHVVGEVLSMPIAEPEIDWDYAQSILEMQVRQTAAAVADEDPRGTAGHGDAHGQGNADGSDAASDPAGNPAEDGNPEADGSPEAADMPPDGAKSEAGHGTDETENGRPPVETGGNEDKREDEHMTTVRNAEELSELGIETRDAAAPAQARQSRKTAEEAGDWVEHYLKHDPDMAKTFEDAGIDDEGSYILYRESLPAEVAREADVFAFKHAIGAERPRDPLLGDALHDPALLARLAPDWLRGRSLRSLEGDRTIMEELRIAGYRTVGELAATTSADLGSLPGLGTGYIQNLRHLGRAITAEVERGEGAEEKALETAGRGTLLEAVDAMMAREGERTTKVLRIMGGYDGPVPEFTVLGEAIGLTGSGARKAYVRVMQDIRDRESLGRLFSAKVRREIEASSGVLTLLELEMADPWFDGLSERPDLADILLETLCPTDFDTVGKDGIPHPAMADKETKAYRLLRFEGVHYIAPVTQHVLDELARDARAHLKALAERGDSEGDAREMTRQGVRDALVAILGRAGPAMAGHIADTLLARALFWNRDGADRIYAFGVGADAAIALTLRCAREPLTADVLRAAVDRAAGKRRREDSFQEALRGSARQTADGRYEARGA